MTKGEFLNRLKHDLGNDLNSAQVQEHVNYYDSYIREEVSKGRSESEVIDELGDPWAIAKNIVLGQSFAEKNQKNSDKKNTGKSENPDKGTRAHSFSLDTRWKRILAVAAVVVVILVVFSLFNVIFRVLSPILIIVMVILMLAQIINRRRGGGSAGSG